MLPLLPRPIANLADRRARASSLRHLSVGALSLVMVAGCVDGDEPPVEPAYGYLADQAPPCELESRWFRVTDVSLPDNGAEAAAIGLDIDDDGRGDGGMTAFLAQWLELYQGAPAAVAANTRAQLDTDEVAWLVETQRCIDGAGDHRRVGLHRGAIDGDGRTVLVEEAPPAVGDELTTPRRGAALLPASLFVDIVGDAPVAWVRGESLSIETTLQTGLWTTLLGQVTVGLVDYRDALAEPLARFYTTQLAAGTSPTAIEMDTDGDDVITRAEVLAHALVDALVVDDIDLLAEVDGDRVLWPQQDGEKDALGIALTFEAVPVDAP